MADRSAAAPFLRPGWIAAWQRAFGTGELELLVAHRHGRIAGILPVLASRGVLRSPTNWHTPLFGAVAEDDSAVGDLVGALADRTRYWFDLSFLAGDDPLLGAAEEIGFRLLRRVVQRAPYVALNGDWSGFEQTLSRSRRSQLRRFERRLAEQGSVSFEIVEAPADLESALEEGFRLEGSGWKAEGGTAILSRAETTRFYREIAQWAAARGELRLWFLRLDGRALAFAYCLEADGVHYECKTGFDPRQRRFAPGILLTRAKLRHAFEAGMRRYEFLGHAVRHKLEWTDRCHDLIRVQAFTPTLAGATGRAMWAYGRPVAKKLRGALRR